MTRHGFHHNRIVLNDDPVLVAEAVMHFTKECEDAAEEINVKGKVIAEVAARLPGYVEYRYGQLQEIDAIRAVLEIRYQKILQESRKRYLEGYNRALSAQQVEKYAVNDDAVIEAQMLLSEMDYVSKRFIGITKAQEVLSKSIYNVVELRKHGLEGSVF